MGQLSTLFFLYSFIGFVSSARILCLFPVPFYSHQSVFQVLTKELSSRGHELVVIAPAHHVGENITEINLKNISEAVWHQEFTPYVHIFYERSKKTDTITAFDISVYTVLKNTDAILSSSAVQALIQNKHEKFDLILIEECIPANLVIAARFNAPVILVSSYYSNLVGLRVTGSESNPIYYPDNNFEKILWNGALWEKMEALIFSIRLNLLYWRNERLTNNLIKYYFGANTPTIRELRNNIQMMFLNVYQVWDFSRPVPPSVIYTSGLHLKDPKPLPEDLKSYLDNAVNGVVVMSFGSKFGSSDLPEETLKVILNVFDSIPYKVIWKMDGKLPGQHNNIRSESWLPQNDLLHHPSVKVLITHAGLQSTDEAIVAGVPVIALPLCVDQFKNAQNYELHGIGVQLNIKSLNEKEFREAIFDVAENERYRNNIKKLDIIMRQHRTNGLNKIMHYIDYVLKHGDTHLHSPTANLFEEYYELDVILPLIFVTLMVFFILLQLSQKLFHAVIKLCKINLNSFS